MDEDDDWDAETEDGDDEEVERPVFFALLADPRRQGLKPPPDKIYERLVDEVFDPNPLRSHVITLHLYIEYWLDRLLQIHKVKRIDKLTFHQKAKKLKELRALTDDLYSNIEAINKLRNIYAHELELEKAEKEVREHLSKLRLDPYFSTSDKDPFRTACIQTMLFLEVTAANGGKPPSQNAFPHERAKSALKGDGTLFWQQCEILRKEAHGHTEIFHLRCPLCQQGEIIREKDNTPGFKESFFQSCSVCGLTGDGSTLKLSTAKEPYRSG